MHVSNKPSNDPSTFGPSLDGKPQQTQQMALRPQLSREVAGKRLAVSSSRKKGKL
jgi:hypothetical protein